MTQFRKNIKSGILAVHTEPYPKLEEDRNGEIIREETRTTYRIISKGKHNYQLWRHERKKGYYRVMTLKQKKYSSAKEVKAAIHKNDINFRNKNITIYKLESGLGTTRSIETSYFWTPRQTDRRFNHRPQLTALVHVENKKTGKYGEFIGHSRYYSHPEEINTARKQCVNMCIAKFMAKFGAAKTGDIFAYILQERFHYWVTDLKNETAKEKYAERHAASTSYNKKYRKSILKRTREEWKKKYTMK